jgi:hypothetical protein
MGVTYPIVRSTGPLEAQFDHPSVLPTSILYDRGGRQKKRWNGGVSEKVLADAVEDLLP